MGFFSKKCDEKLLFGYICVALSAEYRNHKKESRPFELENIVLVTNMILRSKNLKIDENQKNKVLVASMVIGNSLFLDEQAILKIAAKFAVSQSEQGFDFTIPEIKDFRNYLSKNGVIFYY